MSEAATKPRRVEDWPWPEANDMRRWHEVTEAHYWELLGCVPPLDMFPGGFLVGECALHMGDGTPVHACFVEYGHCDPHRFFLREIPVPDRIGYVQELRDLVARGIDVTKAENLEAGR